MKSDVQPARFSSRSTKWPRKPAPPVSNTRLSEKYPLIVSSPGVEAALFVPRVSRSRRRSACRRFLHGQLEIGVHHDADEVRKHRLRLPAKDGLGLGRIAEQEVHFRGPLETRVDGHVV